MGRCQLTIHLGKSASAACVCAVASAMALIFSTATTKLEYSISTIETSYVSEIKKDAGAIHNICLCVGLHVMGTLDGKGLFGG